MRLVHDQDGVQTTLASQIEIADSRLAQARGLMFRGSVDDDFALVFPFDKEETHSLHMLFVPFDIDAVWLSDGEVQKVKRLDSWTGIAWGRGDCILELPAGAAAEVAVGDRVTLVDGTDDDADSDIPETVPVERRIDR